MQHTQMLLNSFLKNVKSVTELVAIIDFSNYLGWKANISKHEIVAIDTQKLSYIDSGFSSHKRSISHSN